VPDGTSPLAYNSTWQVRNDAWCSLEESSAQLVLAGARHRPVEELGETIAKLLDVLGPIERFWAFPGMPAFGKVRRLFAAGKYDRFAALVRGINRALATDSFRTGQAWDLGAEDEASPDRPALFRGPDRRGHDRTSGALAARGATPLAPSG